MNSVLRRTSIIATGAAFALAATAATASACAASHREVTVGDTTYNLTLAAESTLDPGGQRVFVAGHGYNERQGIFVALCAIPDAVDVTDPRTFTERPTPCLGGRAGQDSPGASHRVVNGATGDHTSPYRTGGSFVVALDLNPTIEPGKVCDVDVRCAIVTRADFTATADRSYDVYRPVRFDRR